MFYSVSTCFPSYCGPKKDREDFSAKEAAAIYTDVFLTSLAVLGLAYAFVALSGADLGPLNALSADLGQDGLSTLAKGIGGFLTAEALALICASCKRVQRLQQANRILKTTVPQPIEIRHHPDPELTAENGRLKEQLAQLQGELSRRPIQDDLNAANQRTEQAKQAAARREEEFGNLVQDLTGKLQHATAQVTHLKGQVETKEKYVNALTMEKATCERTIEGQKQLIRDLEKDLQAQDEEAKQYDVQLNQVQQDAQRQIKQIRLEKDALETKLKLQGTIEVLNKQIEALQQTISDKQKEQKQLQEAIEQTAALGRNKLEELKKECEKLTLQKQALVDAEQTAQKTIEALNKQIEETQKELKKLEELKSQAKKECEELSSKKQELERLAATIAPPPSVVVSRLPAPDLESSMIMTTTTTTTTTPISDMPSPIKFAPGTPSRENRKSKRNLLNLFTSKINDLWTASSCSLQESDISADWVMIGDDKTEKLIKEGPKVIQALGEKLEELDQKPLDPIAELELVVTALEWADHEIALTSSLIEASTKVQPPPIGAFELALQTPPPPMTLEQAVSEVKADREELLRLIKEKDYTLKHAETQTSVHVDAFANDIKNGKGQLKATETVNQPRIDENLAAIQNGHKALKKTEINEHKNGPTKEQESINQLAARMNKATKYIAERVLDDFEQDWDSTIDQPFEAPAEASIETKNISSIGKQLSTTVVIALKPSEIMGMAKEKSISFREENQNLYNTLTKRREQVTGIDDEDNE